jgi:hypothetical protein
MGLDERNPFFQRAFPTGNLQTWRYPHNPEASQIARVAVGPQATPDETRSLALGTCERVVDWLRSACDSWGASDRIAVVVGLPPRVQRTARRIAHGWVAMQRTRLSAGR